MQLKKTIFTSILALNAPSVRKEKRENSQRRNSQLANNSETTTIEGFHECSNSGHFRRRGKSILIIS